MSDGRGEFPSRPLAQGGIPRSRILIVDDERLSRVLLSRLLHDMGHVALEAGDGEAALEVARRESPDLALVDLVMEGMSGYEVCERIRGDPATSGIPVIMVTALTNVADLERGFLAGATDYIRKPFNPRELVARVRNALALKHSTEEVRRWQARVSRELDMAGAIQRRLLSTAPLLVDPFEIRMAYCPSAAVGGDLFDAMRLADGRLAVYICDVAGHGVGPALVSSLLKGLIAEIVRDRAARGPAAICRELGRRFRHHVQNPEIYATLFLALHEPGAGEWICMNCGHPPPLFLAPGRPPVEIGREAGGPPIGFELPGLPPYAEADECRAPATPGSMLLLYTDGLSEASDPSGCDAGEVLGAVAVEAAAEAGSLNPALRLMERLRERAFDLSHDDCSAVSIACLDPADLLFAADIDATMLAVEGLARDAESALLRAGWPDEGACAVRLLLMEHGANIVEHGAPPPSTRIRCRILHTGVTCRIDIADQGREWDLASHIPRAVADADEGGRGIGIIRAIAQRTDVFRRDNENVACYVVSRDFGAAGAGER
jgi:sigma-B regulation protein RsbU (phosphoserine phosphatase)